MLKDSYLTCLCLQMRHRGIPSTSSSSGSMAEEHKGTTDGTEGEIIPLMLQQHAATEMASKSSIEEVCKQELDNYFEYVWRLAGHERRVAAEQ